MADSGVRRELEGYIFNRMVDSKIMGMSIATVQNGQVTYTRNFGFKDFERGISPTSDTIYCIGSVTKSFTALAIMQLQESGFLNINDPVSSYIPFSIGPEDEQILIRHLLSHSSGLSSLGYAEATLGALNGTNDTWFPICSPRDLLVFMNGVEEWTISKPGERYGYLNEGYILLGSIIENITRQSYTEYVKKNILNPLGMKRSTFLEEDVEKLGDVSVPYVTSTEGNKVPTRYPYGQMIADGGLMSTVKDLTRYVIMLISGGALDGVQVALESSVLEMMTPQIRTDEVPLDGRGYTHYGYGLRIRSGFLGHNLVYHSGSVFGSSAHIGFVPDRDVGVVILCNGGYFLKDIGDYALSLLMGRTPGELLYFNQVRTLDDLTGTYASFRGLSCYKISRAGGSLQLTWSFGRRSYSHTLYPKDVEGNIKTFEIIGVEAASPVIFKKKGGQTFMIYDGFLAKKISPL